MSVRSLGLWDHLNVSLLAFLNVGEVSLKSGDLVCFMFQRACRKPLLLLISVSLCVFFPECQGNKGDLVLRLQGGELCLHMYLLTLDPPPKCSCMSHKDSNLFG